MKYEVSDEEHWIFIIEKIKEVCNLVLCGCDVNFCYLFGSYAKEKAKETSDIDSLDILQLNNNQTLHQEILKDGINIYG